jgi:hypothetical protein
VGLRGVCGNEFTEILAGVVLSAIICSELRSQYTSPRWPALPGPHMCQPARRLESSRKYLESSQLENFSIESIKRIQFSFSPSHLRAYRNIDGMRCSEINDQAKKENLTRVNVAKFYFCLKFALVLVVFVCRQCVEIRRLHSRDRFLSSMLEQNKFILTPSEAELSSFGGFAKTILLESYSVRRYLGSKKAPTCNRINHQSRKSLCHKIFENRCAESFHSHILASWM